MDIREQIESWLKDGVEVEEGKRVKWQIKQESGEMLSAVGSDATAFFVSFTETHAVLWRALGPETCFLEPDRQLELYRTMLRINSEIPVAKLSLKGEEDAIIAEAVVVLEALPREEFEEALLLFLSACKEFSDRLAALLDKAGAA